AGRRVRARAARPARRRPPRVVAVAANDARARPAATASTPGSVRRRARLDDPGRDLAAVWMDLVAQQPDPSTGRGDARPPISTNRTGQRGRRPIRRSPATAVGRPRPAPAPVGWA